MNSSNIRIYQKNGKEKPRKLKMLYKIRPDDVLVKIVRSDNQRYEAIMVPDKITNTFYIRHMKD